MPTCYRGAPESIKNKKFICDFMLGRLAKWMRLLGIDTEYYRDGNKSAILYKAKKENRLILTRSEEIAKNENAYLIHSENLDEQLKEIKEIIDIEKTMSRCPLCNKALIEVKKEQVKEKVPAYIYKSHNSFKRCPDCQRIYWKGSHYKAIKEKINEIFM